MLNRSLTIADAFCGAGGSSEGLRQTFAARNVPCQLVAINHWPAAITTHTANHPDALHHCVDLTKSSIGSLVPNGRVDAIWLSPSCTSHSYAQGGRSIDDQMRAGAWVTTACAEMYQPKLIIVENVPPFVKWGPLDGRGRPIKGRAGETFRAWVASIESLGFRCSYEFLNAADYGEAQTRTRFFLAAIRETSRRSFSWPSPSHSKKGEATLFGALEKWRGAREILDPKLAGKSILARGKPLSAMTLRRIAHGSREYWGSLAGPALATIDEAARVGLEVELKRTPELRAALKKAKASSAGEKRAKKIRESIGRSEKSVERFRALIADLAMWGVSEAGSAELSTLVGGNRMNNNLRTIGEPLPTVTTANGGGLYAVEPTLEPIVLGQHGGGAARYIDEPLSTIAGSGAVSIIEGMVVPLRKHASAQGIDQPIPTVTAAGTHHGFAEPIILEANHAGERRCRSPHEPLPTITSKRNMAVAEPFVTSYYGESGGDGGEGHRARGLDEPLPTVVTSNRFAVIEPLVLPQSSGRTLRPIDEPLTTIVTTGGQILLEPFIVPQASVSSAKTVDEPLATITTTSRGVTYVEPFLVAHFGERATQKPRTQSIDDPAWTVTNRGAGDLVEPAVLREFGSVRADRLVVVNGELRVFDIRFRMIQPHELQLAQGFPATYKFPGTKEQQTKMIGNAVSVRVAAALWDSALDILVPRSVKRADVA